MIVGQQERLQCCLIIQPVWPIQQLYVLLVQQDVMVIQCFLPGHGLIAYAGSRHGIIASLWGM